LIFLVLDYSGVLVLTILSCVSIKVFEVIFSSTRSKSFIKQSLKTIISFKYYPSFEFDGKNLIIGFEINYLVINIDKSNWKVAHF